MRHVLQRVTGARLALTLAATCSVALAAATPASSAVASPLPSAEQAACSMETALEVGKPYFWDPGMANPIGQVLCGPFAGPGSEAMAMTFNAPTCWSPQGWAVFRFVGGEWRLVVVHLGVLVVPPLEAVGGDIRETRPVYRWGDPRCDPRGGTRARTWRWDGAKLVPGAWTQITTGQPLTQATFITPRALGVHCYVSDRPRVRRSFAVQAWCQSERVRPSYLGQDAKLRGNGRVILCRARGDGRRCQIVCACDEHVQTLRYGQAIVVGRFRCVSRRTGVSCTVARSGKGFRINKHLVRRIGPR